MTLSTRRVIRCRILNEVMEPIGIGRTSRPASRRVRTPTYPTRSASHSGAGAPSRKRRSCASASGRFDRVSDIEHPEADPGLCAMHSGARERCFPSARSLRDWFDRFHVAGVHGVEREKGTAFIPAHTERHEPFRRGQPAADGRKGTRGGRGVCAGWTPRGVCGPPGQGQIVKIGTISVIYCADCSDESETDPCRGGD